MTASPEWLHQEPTTLCADGRAHMYLCKDCGKRGPDDADLDRAEARVRELEEALGGVDGIIWHLECGRYKGHGDDALEIARAALEGAP